MNKVFAWLMVLLVGLIAAGEWVVVLTDPKPWAPLKPPCRPVGNIEDPDWPEP